MLRQTRTENGLVRGIAAANPRITAYKGIPFAAPPVGKLRWRAPEPAANWEGVRQCLEFGPISMQDKNWDPNAFYSREWHVDPSIPMSEDCLYLNIWTPAKSVDEKLPVMIWIFGGGLSNGYTAEMEFDGERIARRGVILVSVAYRVNVFGFMSHPGFRAENPKTPFANWGFLDQKAGIDWVGRNISNFGGDPNNITIFGQSAGGGSVLAHLGSPLAKGSFHKAIIMSSSSVSTVAPLRPVGSGLFDSLRRVYLRPGAIKPVEPPKPTPASLSAPPRSGMRRSLEDAEKAGEAFLKFLGVKSLDEARGIDAAALYAKHAEFGERWSSVVDGRYVVEETTKLAVEGRLHKVPCMVSNTTDEFCFGPLSDDTETVNKWAKANFGDKAETFLTLTKAKAGSGDPQKIREAAVVNVCELSSQLLLRLCAKNGMTIYHSRFGPEIPGDDAGPYHSSDLWFVFETLAKCWRPFTGKHYDLARKICNYWTNFAKSGDPNGPDIDGKDMPLWKPFTASAPCDMNFLDSVYTTGGDEWLNFVADYNYDKLF